MSNLVFFWDGVEWLSYTPSEVAESTHIATKESRRSEIAKDDPENAEKYDWTSEWDLYDDIKIRTSNVFIEANRGKQLEAGSFYTTYDKTMGKFVCMSLTNGYNFFMVDDLNSTIPKTFESAPSTQISSISALTDTVLNLLAWVNERRF